MKEERLILIFLIVSQFAFSQIKGVVKDSISGEPIPYVNIWVEGEQIAGTTEANGVFNLPYTGKGVFLVFTSVGYQRKRVPLASAGTVLMQPESYILEEVTLVGQKFTKELEIGIRKNTTYQAFDNGPKIETKFFPYFDSYRKTKYIKKVRIQTDSRIDGALIKLHFYGVDENGFPGAELLKKELIISVKSGVTQMKIDISDYNLVMPKSGLFVGYEKLLIEQNKVEKTVTDPNSGIQRMQRTYYPFILYCAIESEAQFIYSAGKWIKKTPAEAGSTNQKFTIFEPAINLVLSN